MPSKEPIDRNLQRAMRMDRLAKSAFPSENRQQILTSLAKHINRITAANPEIKKDRYIRMQKTFMDRADGLVDHHLVPPADRDIIASHLRKLHTWHGEPLAQSVPRTDGEGIPLKEYYKARLMEDLGINKPVR